MYALPYFSWASAKSGDQYSLEKMLNKEPDTQEPRSDYFLAKAFFTGLRGELDASLKFLARSLDSRLFIDSRPIPFDFQLAEGCEWLYEATGKTAYRDFALKVARLTEKALPFAAWAYAMEAKLSTGNDRKRALGFALYLDPLSERPAKIPEAEKKAAKAQFDRINPFKPPSKARMSS